MEKVQYYEYFISSLFHIFYLRNQTTKQRDACQLRVCTIGIQTADKGPSFASSDVEPVLSHRELIAQPFYNIEKSEGRCKL
jgi:hypothetical protein